MKGSVLALSVIGLAAGAVLAVQAVAQPTPAERACSALRDACGDIDLTGCETDLAEASVAEVEEILACTEPAHSCVEVAACLGGAVVRDVGTGFLRGLTLPR